MQCKRYWTIAIAVLILLTAATGYVSAHVASRSASQTVDDTVTFRVRIQNISSDSDAPTLFAPGAWALHSNADPLFTNGEADRGEGLESLAEDGDPAKLVETLLAKGLMTGNFDTPVCADSPRPLQTGESYEFEVTTSPETPYLSFATMLVQSNDLFLAPSVKGIALFDEDGKAIGAQNVTDQLLLWDAGTEANEEPGAGPNQSPRQSVANTGPADEMATVRPVDDGFSYPDVTDLVTVSIVRVLMVERYTGRQLTPSAVHQAGEDAQVGDVRWRVLSVENLGYELKENNNRQTTEERFIQVRFEFLNLGSNPLEFDGGSLRNRKGVSLGDSQGREYPYYLVPRIMRPDGPPHDFVPDNEDCYGEWTWRGWRPFILKPNAPTTCTVIYEVDVDATGLVFIASDLGEKKESKIAIGLNLSPTPIYAIGEDVRVGDVRWQVLSAEDLGQVLDADSNREKTKERFVAVRFQLTNKGSADLGFRGATLRDSQGREHERGKFEFVAKNERCKGGILGPFALNPNVITTCTSIYEIPTNATGLIFIADDLDGREDSTEIVALGLSDVLPVHIYLIEEDVEVGDVCWHVLSVEELGQELKNDEGDTATTAGRFIQTQFRLLNLGSRTLGYDGVSLVDGRGREYSHFGERLNFIADDVECPPSRIPPGPYSLEPNTPSICTTIHEVAEDAKNFTLLASDLEGYETKIVALPAVNANECPPDKQGPISPGTHSVCKEVAPGIYRGEASEDSFCQWDD